MPTRTNINTLLHLSKQRSGSLQKKQKSGCHLEAPVWGRAPVSRFSVLYKLYFFFFFFFFENAGRFKQRGAPYGPCRRTARRNTVDIDQMLLKDPVLESPAARGQIGAVCTMKHHTLAAPVCLLLPVQYP